MTKIKTVSAASLPPLLAPFEGGLFGGLYRQDNETRALIVSGKDGDIDDANWGEYGQDIAGARSYTDGLENTRAMAETGSALATQVLALRIGGFDGWAIPARDQLELIYRHFKPTAEKNYIYRSGDNPSSIPAGYPYTEDSPTQATIEAFQEGGEHALHDAWYWTSTQCSSGAAWAQDFCDGCQLDIREGSSCRARAVRSVVVTN